MQGSQPLTFQGYINDKLTKYKDQDHAMSDDSQNDLVIVGHYFYELGRKPMTRELANSLKLNQMPKQGPL